jgi:hypothetical protein
MADICDEVHSSGFFPQNMAKTEDDNVALHKTIMELRAELDVLRSSVHDHLKYCQKPDQLADVLREVDK